MEYQLPQKQLGSELQTEYGWSKNIPENIFLFFFQLVRNKNIDHLEKQLHQLLTQNNCIVKMYLLRILAYTRDIKYGAGEKNLAYMQLFVWFHYFPKVSAYILIFFVSKYGSWRDIPYFAQYVLDRTNNPNHFLITLCMHIMIKELKENKNPLAAKWAPREKSKFHWLFKKMAFLTFQHFLQTAKTEKSLAGAKRKAKTKFRQLIKQDTIESRLCSNKKINFSSLSPSTLLKYSPTFQRKFPSQFALFLDNSCFSKNNLHLGEKLTRAAYHQKAPPALLNKLWKCTPIKLDHTIALLQTSASMLHNYSAIALAIRISEEAKEPLKNQVILFSQQPKLIRFEENKTFTEKVAILKQEMEGLGNKLYPAIHFLAQELQKITKCVPNVKVIIISNMQIEPEHLPDPFPLTTNIKKIFKKNKTTIPQIILWNMKSSNGFPGLYFEKNITMISGNNHHLLKYLPNNNPTRRPYTTTITKIINSKRYSIMDRILMDCVL